MARYMEGQNIPNGAKIKQSAYSELAILEITYLKDFRAIFGPKNI